MKFKDISSPLDSHFLVYLITYLAVLLSFLFIRPDIVLMVVYVFIILFCLKANNAGYFYRLFVSSAIGFIWMAGLKGKVLYTCNFFDLFGFQLFIFLGWSLSLFCCHTSCSRKKRGKITDDLIADFYKFTLLFIILLVVSETYGYHVVGIKNILSENNHGIPVFNSIHAPLWIKISYFLTGPLYYVICTFIEMKFANRSIRLSRKLK